MVKIQEKFSLFHKMDIWAVRSNSYGFLQSCGNLISWHFILFYKDELRNSKRGAAIPHLNKELFYNLPIGIPPLAEQQRIACQINNLFQLINNNSIIATIRLCSFRGGSGNKRLFKLLEFNVLPFMASLESPRLDIIGKM